jgi:transcriptional regulator with XRE-family HTH domain
MLKGGIGMSNVSNNIKRIIKENELKHSAVAKRAGYSYRQFSALVCGRKIIKDNDIESIAKALNVTPNDLFAETTEQETI